MTRYTLSFYYQGNIIPSHSLKELGSVDFPGTPKQLMASVFPDQPVSHWFTARSNNKRNTPGYCNMIDNGLYMRVEWVSDNRIRHVHLWRHRDWIRHTMHLNDAIEYMNCLNPVI